MPPEGACKSYKHFMIDYAWDYLRRWKKNFGKIKQFAEVTKAIENLERRQHQMVK